MTLAYGVNRSVITLPFAPIGQDNRMLLLPFCLTEAYNLTCVGALDGTEMPDAGIRFTWICFPRAVGLHLVGANGVDFAAICTNINDSVTYHLP